MGRSSKATRALIVASVPVAGAKGKCEDEVRGARPEEGVRWEETNSSSSSSGGVWQRSSSGRKGRCDGCCCGSHTVDSGERSKKSVAVWLCCVHCEEEGMETRLMPLGLHRERKGRGRGAEEGDEFRRVCGFDVSFEKGNTFPLCVTLGNLKWESSTSIWLSIKLND
ncbi:uncharacterized protein LOC111921680 [Lactuca sativa]|uniref:Uncharacterized protein n=1 Tax=Lactuca sativa TaxID=4236 RepID=A0A9R1UH43_LACSA|nr:uncharacterized protein LOC111921680 [Lactuca sativa]KAJ0187325.1 hypothetical protein LSAT_V11C900458250 [Lactuca sativa]